VSFSPDGQWITYTDMAGASFWRSRADGTEPLLLAKAPWEVELSSWSPDGKRVAFMGRTPGKPWRIYLVSRDGGSIEQASDGEDNQGAPSWSPDGNHLVYGNVVCEKTENCWIRRLNLATRTAEIVHGSNGMRTARWSPDGKYIAALRVHAHELLIFDHRTEQWRTLAGSVNGDNISWSNDSQFVYVDNPRDKKAVVERIRIRDGQRVPVVSLGPLERISGQLGPWFGLTPDGSLIFSHLLSTGEIYELKWTDQ
jgi:Tol biopolymer transport system component